MDNSHYLWLLLTIACIVWYSTITIYVSIKGAQDIKMMLDHLNKKHLDLQNSRKNSEAK